MKAYEDDTWGQHAAWVWAIYKKTVNPEECASLYMATIFGDIHNN